MTPAELAILDAAAASLAVNGAEQLADELRALSLNARVPIAQAPTMCWLPIETAPKDETDVLVCYDAASVLVAHIAWWRNRNEALGFGDEDVGWWSYTRGSVTQELLDGFREPKHWMPLPATPEAPGTQDGEAREWPNGAVWSEHIAGLIATYLREPDETRVKAIAGIINRRLWQLVPRLRSVAPEATEPVRPDIIEKLTYHQLERYDMTLDDVLSYLATGWKTVPGRTERQLILQLCSLMAGAPEERAAP